MGVFIGRAVSGKEPSISMVLENDIEPVGIPFYPEGINHRGEMYMVFSKETVKRYIEIGINRSDKLQAIYDSMPDGGVCVMIVN